MSKLRYNSVVEKSLDRLKAMGLNVHVLDLGENEALIFITLDSVMKLIEKQIKFPNKELKYESPFIVIRVWRV